MPEVRTLTLALPPTAQAARAARRFVAAALADWGCDAVLDRAVLLASELIANSVLHARTPLTLTVAAGADGSIRVTVADASLRLPHPRSGGLDAATGRGLALLDELADGWCAAPEAAGKAVTFVLNGRSGRVQPGSSPAAGGQPSPAAVSPLGRYDPLRPGSSETVQRVRLLGLPVALHAASRDHHDELLRECAVLAVAGTEPAPPEPLARLVDVLGTRYALAADRPDRPVDAALAAGQATVDLDFDVPAHASVAADRIAALLADADRLSRDGLLLTLPRPPVLVDLADWYTGEIRRQIAGLPPIRWTGPLQL